MSYFMFISAVFRPKSHSTDVTRVSCGVSCLSVVGYVLRLYPQATIIAPIKLLQHYHVRFNVMLLIQFFVLENLSAGATFPVVGGDNTRCPLDGAGWSKAMSLHPNFIV